MGHQESSDRAREAPTAGAEPASWACLRASGGSGQRAVPGDVARRRGGRRGLRDGEGGRGAHDDLGSGRKPCVLGDQADAKGRDGAVGRAGRIGGRASGREHVERAPVCKRHLDVAARGDGLAEDDEAADRRRPDVPCRAGRTGGGPGADVHGIDGDLACEDRDRQGIDHAFGRRRGALLGGGADRRRADAENGAVRRVRERPAAARGRRRRDLARRAAGLARDGDLGDEDGGTGRGGGRRRRRSGGDAGDGCGQHEHDSCAGGSHDASG